MDPFEGWLLLCWVSGMFGLLAGLWVEYRILERQ